MTSSQTGKSWMNICIPWQCSNWGGWGWLRWAQWLWCRAYQQLGAWRSLGASRVWFCVEWCGITRLWCKWNRFSLGPRWSRSAPLSRAGTLKWVNNFSDSIFAYPACWKSCYLTNINKIQNWNIRWGVISCFTGQGTGSKANACFLSFLDLLKWLRSGWMMTSSGYLYYTIMPLEYFLPPWENEKMGWLRFMRLFGTFSYYFCTFMYGFYTCSYFLVIKIYVFRIIMIWGELWRFCRRGQSWFMLKISSGLASS